MYTIVNAVMMGIINKLKLKCIYDICYIYETNLYETKCNNYVANNCQFSNGDFFFRDQFIISVNLVKISLYVYKFKYGR